MTKEETCNCKEEHNCECENIKEKKEKCNCDKKEHKKIDKKEEKIKELEGKIKELEDKALRDKADSINFRKRKEEELSRMLKFKDEELISEMLPIIDNFESAIKMDDNNLDDEVSKFLSGFKMIYGNLLTVLEHFDVKVIDGKNKPFDPTYHQAVMTEKVDGIEKDMVIEVLRKGYLLKDKVLRPAMVKVSE
jgi:molecular chaperone GrpE